MGEKNTIALLTSINGYLKTMVDSSKQNNAQSPEDKEKKSVKNSEKQVKTLSTGGLGSGLKTEIKEAVTRWIGNIKLNDIQIVQNKDDEHEIFVRLDYTVSDGNKSTSDSVVVQL